MSQLSTQSNILLESDTNELEIVEFCVNEVDHKGEIIPCYYGVNVAKVREIIRLPSVTKTLQDDPAIEGMIRLRDKVIPLINLSNALGKNAGNLKADRVIVLEFNNVVVGAMVHSVSRIYRISWTDVEVPSKIGRSQQITGLVKMDNRIILVLDFEKIIGGFCSSNVLKDLEQSQLFGRSELRSLKTVLVADDSYFIRTTMCGTLRTAGYNIIEAVNGAEALKMLQSLVTTSKIPDLLITDIEMPQMDGLHLTSLIRKDPLLKDLPVIIFSSLASDDNRKKWHELGANQILSKPELPRLVECADILTGTNNE